MGYGVLKVTRGYPNAFGTMNIETEFLAMGNTRARQMTEKRGHPNAFGAMNIEGTNVCQTTGKSRTSDGIKRLSRYSTYSLRLSTDMWKRAKDKV